MVFQDWFIAVWNVIMGFGLIPQIKRGFDTKLGTIKLSTSVIMTAGMLSLGINFLTLHLYMAAGINFVLCVMWAVLAFQTFKYGL